MQKSLLCSAYLLVTTLSAPCVAQDSAFGMLGRIGSASQSIEQANFDERDTSFAVGGVYRLNTYLAAELRYDHFGTVTFGSASDQGELSASAFSLGAIAALPIANHAKVYAKAGAAHWRNELDDALGSNHSDGTNFYYGIGAEYQFRPDTSMVLEYSAIELEAYATYQIVDYRIGNLALGINYYF